jgi:hypothetical protein
MAKKKIVTPEDDATITIPEDGDDNPMVWMLKTRTNCSSPLLGDFYKGRKYHVLFSTFLELHRNGEAELCDTQQ